MITITCLICGKKRDVFPSDIKAGKGKFCSIKCRYKSQIGHIPWNKGIKSFIAPWNRGRKMLDYPQMGFQKGHPVYNKKGRFKKGQIPWNKGLKAQLNTGKTHFKKGQNIDLKNINWKGDDVGYIALHAWIYRKKGKPQVCEHCGATREKRRLNWANIDHQYKRDLDDFISLCVSCHKIYDLNNN
jgi:hypothetical protein